MMDSAESDSLRLAALLERWSKGEKDAYDQLLTHLYGDIHAIAVRQLHRERYLTIRPTALVHEVYLRLSNLRQMQWQDRAHFLSMAARVTRQALVDEARRRRAEKRDGGRAVTLSDTNLGVAEAAYDALDVDQRPRPQKRGWRADPQFGARCYDAITGQVSANALPGCLTS
jgi:RNA polymerase sigma factor (TIGR02999 family)